MKIVVNGVERDATPEEEAAILSQQEADANRPAPVQPLALRQIAAARLTVDQDMWEVTGVERSQGISGAFLVDTDLVWVYFTQPMADIDYIVMPADGVTKFPDHVEVTRPGLSELSFIIQKVQ